MYEVLEKQVDSQSKTQIEINHQHITYQNNRTNNHKELK